MKITLKEKEYIIADQWLDISIGQLQRMTNIDQTIEEIDKTIEIIHIISGIEKEDLYELPFTEYKKLINVLVFMGSEIPNELLRNITIDGVEYKFYCDLDMSTGQYFDMDYMIKSGDPSHLHTLMGICYRETEKYNSRDVKKRADIFKEKMSVNYAIGAQAFFQILGQDSLNHIQDYMMKQPI